MTGTEFETVIGLEVHVELATQTKMFCSCANRAGETPNSLTCPMCAGLPGAMPVVNGEAVRLALIAGDVLHCRINEMSRFDRKHYFYPDLPKGYQITQYFHPLCEEGWMEYRLNGERKRFRVTRIHLEEDAGKLFHEDGETLLDLNRCGVPLIEIVTEPDFRSPQEAAAAFRELRRCLKMTGVTVGHMNEGHLRCDVNLSIHRVGEPFGTRCEIKNLNSFSSVEKACAAEIERQKAILDAGGVVRQMTMRFDGNATIPMRPKETPEDYRYMPEPDLPPLRVEVSCIEREKTPLEWETLWNKEFGLPYDTGEKLSHSTECAKAFQRTACNLRAEETRLLAILITEELSALSESLTDEEAFDSPVSFERIAEVAVLWNRGEMNATTAKKLVRILCEGMEQAVEEYCKEHRMLLIRDKAEIAEIALKAVEACPAMVASYRGGKTKVFQAILGKAMGICGGLCDAVLLQEELRKILDT